MTTKTGGVSKRPWSLSEDGTGTDADGKVIYDESSCGGGGFDTRDDERMAFHAVNCHDEFVEAIKRTMDLLEYWRGEQKAKAFKILEAALQKAERGE